MATLSANLSVVLNILKVVFGLGFVIFIHELGHFLAAKWAGVKVEKFFLGFDPYGLRLFTFTRGETTYGIGAVPLGGYVKMLGEDPGEGEERSSDPRAFGNKPVGARAVILSAGVAMNLVLGLILFTTSQMLGVQEMPARLGVVHPGTPAYLAGLRPGDEVVSVDGRGDVNFDRMTLRIRLSSADQSLSFGVKRPGVAETLTIPVVPERQGKATMPNIGVSPCESLVLLKGEPYDPPAGIDGPPPAKDAIPGGGKVVEIGPLGGPATPVDDIFALDAALVRHRDHPIEMTFEAPRDPGAAQGTTPARTRATFPVTRLLTLGLRMTPGPISSIQKGSIAEKAGFRKGDRIIKIDGQADYDPMTLPDDLLALAGKPVAFVVERPTAAGAPETVEISATPDDLNPWVETSVLPADALKLSGLGMAIDIEPRVAAVAEGSPAAKHGIAPGAVLDAITFPPLKDDPKAKPFRLVFREPTKAEADTNRGGWPYVAWRLQAFPRQELSLTLAGSSTPILLTAEPDPSRTNPLRGLNFQPIINDVPPQPFVTALKRGWAETYDNVVSIYAMIRSLFGGRVSPKNLAGLPRIANAAYQIAGLGLVPLLGFLAMLSINLAVLNFLPIPPLDGGQIAFLAAEKIRGKPLPENTLFVFMVAGIALVGCLMLFTIIQDIVLMVFG